MWLADDLARVDSPPDWDQVFGSSGPLDLEIGSGRVEAAGKHVIGQRMKQSGMRWSKPGSQNTLALHVAWLNGDWDRLWASHPSARAA